MNTNHLNPVFFLAISLCLFTNIGWSDVELDTPMFVETSIEGISFCDPKSTTDILGKTPKLHHQKTGFSYYKYVNPLGTEIITLIGHPGDYRYSISEVKVTQAIKSENLPVFPRNNPHFVSGKGVYLGMSRAQFLKLYEKPINDISSSILEYRLENNQALLKTFNMPLYYGEYKFSEEKLVEFSFGFEYP